MRLTDSVAILNTAIVAYHLLIRLKGLLAILLAIANFAECSASGRSQKGALQMTYILSRVQCHRQGLLRP
jgi:hypothetical protein